MDEKSSPKSLLIVGAGGIGTTVVDLLVPALDRIQLSAQITLMDGDTVEASNLGHQNYTATDIGAFKVDALAGKWFNANGIQVRSVAENLRQFEQLKGYDLIVVCVDRPEPRRLVHSLDVPWIDLRCSGDGWMVFTSDSNPELVAQMTKHWDQVVWEDVSNTSDGPYESGLLKLNCDKAMHHLGWRATWDFETTVRETVLWYKGYYEKSHSTVAKFSTAQIKSYVKSAKELGINWAQ